MFDPTRRGLLASIAGLAVLSACKPGAAGNEVRVGYLRTQGPIVDLPINTEVIESAGIKLFPFESGNDVLEAVMANGIDVGETGEIQPIFAQSAGQKVKVVGSTEPAGLTSMLVQKGSPLRTIADLKGRKVSFMVGTNSNWLLISALRKVGLTQADIVPISLNGPESLGALQGGEVDAIVLTAPATQVAIDQGARVLFTNAGLTNSALYYVAREAIIDTRPELIERFLRGLSAHIDWSAKHPDRFVAHAARELGVSPQVARSLFDVLPKKLVPVGTGAIAAYNQRIADAFLAQRLIPGRIDAAQSVDGRFDKVLQA